MSTQAVYKGSVFSEITTQHTSTLRFRFGGLAVSRKEKIVCNCKLFFKRFSLGFVPSTLNLDSPIVTFMNKYNEGRAHYIIVSKVQWKPLWLATQQYPQNDWTGWQFTSYV